MRFALSPSCYTLGFGPGDLTTNQVWMDDCGKDSTAEIVIFLSPGFVFILRHAVELLFLKISGLGLSGQVWV